MVLLQLLCYHLTYFFLSFFWTKKEKHRRESEKEKRKGGNRNNRHNNKMKQKEANSRYFSSGGLLCRRLLGVRRRSGGESDRRLFGDLFLVLGSGGGCGCGSNCCIFSDGGGDRLLQVKGLREVIGGENLRRNGLGGLASMTTRHCCCCSVLSEWWVLCLRESEGLRVIYWGWLMAKHGVAVLPTRSYLACLFNPFFFTKGWRGKKKPKVINQELWLLRVRLLTYTRNDG